MTPVQGPSAWFERSVAILIGIDNYSNGIPRLRSAAADVAAVATALRTIHHFHTECLIDSDATLSGVSALLSEKLPQYLGSEDRLLLYFAGHGIALDDHRGPSGYLLLADSTRGDVATYLPMHSLHTLLSGLGLKHLLVVLDCCFSVSFRWSSFRDLSLDHKRIHIEQYERFLSSRAWQVLTSASANQQAVDSLSDSRGTSPNGHNSPFASSFVQGINGGADYHKNGIVTVSQLAIYLRSHVEPLARQSGVTQTPQTFTLPMHEHGEFLFHDLSQTLTLKQATELDEAPNPYRGLEHFTEQDDRLFFGRSQLIGELLSFVEANQLIAVVGSSGSGKSSIVRAGLIPAARHSKMRVASPTRPGGRPTEVFRLWAQELGQPEAQLESLAARDAISSFIERCNTDHSSTILCVLDQAEELLFLEHRSRSQLHDFYHGLRIALSRVRHLKIVMVVRSDMEIYFNEGPLKDFWNNARFLIRGMTRDELRETIEGPATEYALYFQPARLIDKLLDDVTLSPTPLPLLSFVLSELYRECQIRWRAGERDRSLQEVDYHRLGSASRALTQRANTVYEELAKEDSGYTRTVRNVFVRMTTMINGELSRRRVPYSELVFDDESENARISRVLQRFHDARLVMLDTELHGGLEARAFAEPCHDELIRGWVQLREWLDEHDGFLGTNALFVAVGIAARTWVENNRSATYLWSDPRADAALATEAARGSVLNNYERQFVTHSVRRRSRRRRFLVGALILLVAVLATTSALALSARNTAIAEKHRADESLAAARDERARAELRADEVVLARARAEVETNPTRAIALVKRLANKHWREVASIAVAARASGVAFSLQASARTATLQMSRDGQRAVAAGSDGVIRLYDFTRRNAAVIAELGGTVQARYADEERKVVAWHDAKLVVIDAATKQRTELTAPTRIRDLEVVGVTAYWIDDQRALWRLDLAGGAPAAIPLDEHVEHLSPSPDGRWIALYGEYHLMLLDRLQPDKKPLEVTAGRTKDSDWSDDGSRLAALVDFNALDISVGRVPGILQRLNVGLRRFVAYGNNRVYTIGATGVAVISRINVENGPRKQLVGEPTSMREARGGTMIAGSTGGIAVLSEYGDHDLFAPVGHIDLIGAHARSSWVIATAEDALFVWNLDDIVPRRLTTEAPGMARFVGSDHVIASAVDEPTTWIDIPTGKARALGQWPLHSVAAAPSGQLACAIDLGHKARLVGPAGEQRELHGEVDVAGFPSDTQLVLGQAETGAVDVFDVRTNQRAPLVKANGKLLDIAWSRGAQPWVAAAFSDGTVWRGNLATSVQAVAPGHVTPTSHLHVTGDGAVLFAEGRAIRIWRPGGAVDTQADLPKPTASIGLAGADHLVAFGDAGITYVVDLAAPNRVRESETVRPVRAILDGDDELSVSMSIDTGLMAVPVRGGIEIVDPILAHRWTLAPAPPQLANDERRSVTYVEPVIASDGKRVVALLPMIGLMAWTIALPTTAAETSALTHQLTNAEIGESGRLVWPSGEGLSLTGAPSP